MTGRIVRAIAGKYYVETESGIVLTCTAKGIFRHDNISPLVGDTVIVEQADEVKCTGNVADICSRRNSLIRPSVANIDQALVVFAAAKPEPNLNLLDRFLVTMMKQDIPVVICFNKKDIADGNRLVEMLEAYRLCGYSTISISVKEHDGLDRISQILKGKTTVLAGPSGVGKSSLLNSLLPAACMETGELSRKTERGKQTTRHTELFKIFEDTYLIDSPGFSSLFVAEMAKDEIRNYYPEFSLYSGRCRFLSCMHIKEPDCAVKEALDKGLISRIRYDNYCLMYDELSHRKQY